MMMRIKIEDIVKKEPKHTLNEDERPTTCVVCGDNTKSYHYETPSCYGCKTFFRRAVVGNKKYACNNNGRCVVTKDTRCICRACRLKKCYEVGMNPHAVGVMTLMKKRKMLQNNEIKEEIVVKSEPLPSTSYMVKQELNSSFEFNMKYIDEILYIESKHEFLRHSNFCPYDEELSLSNLLNMKTSFAETEKYHLVHVWPRIDMSRLATMSGYKLAEMGLKTWFFFDLLLSVDYLKTLEIFQQLPIKDQYYLCVDVSVALAHLSRSYYSFLMGSNTIVICPDGTFPFSHRENLSVIETILQVGKVKNIHMINPDRVHFCLMKIIAAYTSTSSFISQESKIKIDREKMKFAKILLQYLQDQYGGELGAQKFAYSIALLSEFITMAKKYSSIYHSCRHCFEKSRPEQKLSCELRNINSLFEK